MHRFLITALAAVSLTGFSSSAHAAALEVAVFELISGVNQQVASWTQDQDPTPNAYVNNYYTTVPISNSVGLGGDDAVTWYSGTNGQLGGFTNYSEQFNVLAPASYAFLESSPTFVPGSYYGADLKPDSTYIKTYYTISVVREQLFKPAFARFHVETPRNAAVPEPASWAMMLAGFGLIGFIRRRRRGNVQIAGRSLTPDRRPAPGLTGRG